MDSSRENWVEKTWYGNSPVAVLLLPLSWLYACIVRIRRFAYAQGLLRAQSVAVPVIVVGNITAGGTGKTPLTIWLARALTRAGYKPAIVSRGYRGNVGPVPRVVENDSDPAVVGDESLLLRRRSDCIVVVHPERVAAARLAVELGADLVLADDGLQHYGLERDFEIAVVDAQRGIGNGKFLPSGPLRESPARLASVDEIVVQGRRTDGLPGLAQVALERGAFFTLQPGTVNQVGGTATRSLSEFSGTEVHAVAGIGNPARFFATLRVAGIDVIEHPLPDHARISRAELQFDDDKPVIMTGKDAVKCGSIAGANCWYLEVEVAFEDSAGEALEQRIVAAIKKHSTSL